MNKLTPLQAIKYLKENKRRHWLEGDKSGECLDIVETALKDAEKRKKAVEKKCELFLIRTAHIEKGKFGTLRQYFADEDKYIYCPISELKYIISNTDDKSVIEWYKIVEAYRRKDMSLVKPEEVFRQ